MKQHNPVIQYYHTWESKLGYRWLDGIKHFGFYPEGQEHISKKAAQHQMNEQLARALGLPQGAHVLDAGCGEGGVAMYLAQRHGLRVSGIDLLDFNIAQAQRTTRQQQIDTVDFQVGTYMQLPFADNTFDGLYTMETLVHAPDYRQAMAEFYRVLKPGGRLALFEYTITPEADVADAERAALERIRRINRVSSMPAFNEFEHDTFAAKLGAAGFTDVVETDITPRVMPMVQLFYDKARRPYRVITFLRLQDHFINTMSAVEFYEHPDLWRYKIVTAAKPLRT